MKTRFLWMILKISLPSGRHRERRKLNHFDKFLYFLPQRVAIEKRQKLRGKWKYLFYPSRGRAQKAGFYALFSKFFIFGSESEPSSRCLIYEAPNRSHFSSVASKLMPFSGAGFPLWHQNWCHFRERDFRCGIKIDAIFDYLLTDSQWERSFFK